MNIPNSITLARLFMVPFAVYAILEGQYVAAFWIFIVAGLSDGVDGYLAKRLGQQSRLGACLDPIADKTLLVATFLALGYIGWIPRPDDRRGGGGALSERKDRRYDAARIEQAEHGVADRTDRRSVG
jgi:hypothetical protein